MPPIDAVFIGIFHWRERINVISEKYLLSFLELYLKKFKYFKKILITYAYAVLPQIVLLIRIMCQKL